MIVEELLIGLGGLVTTVVSSFVSWGLAKRKYNVEVDHTVIENLEKSLEFYEKLSTHNQEKLTELVEENKHLRKEMSGILEENRGLRRELDELRKQLQEITTNLYLDEAYKNRVKTRELQLRKTKENGNKNNDRLSTTKNTSRRGRKSAGETGTSDTAE